MPQKVTPVPLEIQEHRKSAVRLIATWRDELHASGDHALVHRLEIVDALEHSHAAGELPTHTLELLFAVSPRKQNACLASVGANHNPSLWAAIIGQRRS